MSSVKIYLNDIRWKKEENISKDFKSVWHVWYLLTTMYGVLGTQMLGFYRWIDFFFGMKSRGVSVNMKMGI